MLIGTRVLSPKTDPKDVIVSEPVVHEEYTETYYRVVEKFPPTRGQVTPLIDGRTAFREMYTKLMAAKKYVYITVWYMVKDTVLRGDNKSQKITEILRSLALRGVKVRILASYLETRPVTLGGNKFVLFPNANPAENLKKQLEALDKKNKNIEVLVAKHPHSLRGVVPGSYHEKFIVVDGKYAFCGGLEFAPAYTDADKTHAKSTRHDVHSLLEGPIVKHFEKHFVTRWNETKNPKEPKLPEPTDNFDPQKDLHAVQIAITKSTDGLTKYQTQQQDIYDAYIEAISQAEQYIYIENQYFREESLADALISRLNDKKDLQVILLLPEEAEEKPNPFTNHANFIQYKVIEKLRASDPKRVGIFSIRRGAGRGGDIYVHSKVMVIDDKWATIGSANANPRSFFFDAEINLMIRDDDLIKRFRMDLWKEHLSTDSSNISKLDISNAKQFAELWNQQAASNETRVKKGQKLKGRVIPHHPVKGEELDLDKFDINFVVKMALPDPTDYI